MKTLNSIKYLTIDDLLQHYSGKRIYRAKNSAYMFDLFADRWQTDSKYDLILDFIREAGYSTVGFLMVRRLLAFRTENQSFNTVRLDINSLKNYEADLENVLKFQAVYYRSTKSLQKNSIQLFNALGKDKCSENNELRQYFSEIIAFTKNQKVDQPRYANILDPAKGVYSEIEFVSAKERLRLATGEAISKVNTQASLNFDCIASLSVVVAMQLMVAIVRRPTQLVQLKWCDVLPVGISFGDHRDTKLCGIPEIEHMFGDVEQLHLRSFRGKDGQFRTYAELRSHRLEPDFSTLLLFYRQCYQRLLSDRLQDCGIELATNELAEFMFRCPLFASQEFFNFDFKNKENLFKALTLRSKNFHKSNVNLMSNFYYLNKKLSIESDRIANVKLTNNRLRHTILTEGAINDLSEVQLSMITGVIPMSVRPYIDLSTEARLQIDSAFAEKKIFQQFGSVGLYEIQQKRGFKSVIDEFDEELGVIQQHVNCDTCQAKLGIPLGCYGCDNFRPAPEANHHVNLEKAERKLAINQESGDKGTLKKLLRSIVYIRATITVCDEIKLREKGLRHD